MKYPLLNFALLKILLLSIYNNFYNQTSILFHLTNQNNIYAKTYSSNQLDKTEGLFR